MAKWSGRGQPPTRRKLHKLRQKQLKEKRAEQREARSNASRYDASWRNTRKGVMNTERFEQLWIP